MFPARSLWRWLRRAKLSATQAYQPRTFRWKSANKSACSSELAAAVCLSLRNTTRSGTTAGHIPRRAFTSFPQRRMELSRANCRWLSDCVVCHTSSQPAAPVQLMRLRIVLGRQEMMIAGGVDAPLAPGILAGFNLLTVLTTAWNEEPERASRPFTRNRSGMVLGEGAWMYVLEEYERAKRRGVDIYGEIIGYGSTCDAYHRVRLQEGGDEPARAMTLAMQDAGVSPSDIDYVNLHGTSTVLNDRIETNALKLALNSNSRRVPMSATKSQVGHPQGASGAAGLGAALCAMQTHLIPPTINLDEPDPDCDLDYAPRKARDADVRVALCHCIGFGSKNSALVVRKV